MGNSNKRATDDTMAHHQQRGRQNLLPWQQSLSWPACNLPHILTPHADFSLTRDRLAVLV